ncbi:MAG: permease-like cell division protein FtsX [Eggerthellaceae bacterium]|nr:permease-like cell division protein FtsX [Eggerthellaceae bacterium]
MRNLGYFLKEALIGFKRNFSTAFGSIITIFLSLLIIGIFLIGGTVVENIVTSVENEVSITAYVADDASETDIASVEQAIKNMDHVANVTFTTKDQALENFRNSMTSNPEIINQLDGQNPLPASINVELSDPQQVEQVANMILANPTFKKICDNPTDPSDSLKYGQKTVDRLFKLINYVRYIGLALIILLIVVSFIFINNTIRLAILARRREISIMRLVGASNGFIRGPFLMEGALHAIIGALLAIGVLELLRQFVLPQIKSSLAWMPIDLTTSTVLIVYGSMLVAGLLIGLIGSAVAMRRYLKV